MPPLGLQTGKHAAEYELDPSGWSFSREKKLHSSSAPLNFQFSFHYQSFKQAMSFPVSLSFCKGTGAETLLNFAGGHRNHVTIPSILEAGLKILPHWNVTLPLWQFHQHISAKGEGGACSEVACDCTHTCAPAWGQLFLSGIFEFDYFQVLDPVPQSSFTSLDFLEVCPW